MKIINIVLVLLLSFACISTENNISNNKIPAFASGMKIAEVDSNSAVIWTRLTSVITGNPNSFDKSAPGVDGFVKIKYYPKGRKNQAIIIKPQRVNKNRDYTYHYKINNLLANTSYTLELIALSTKKEKGQTIVGSFKTAPNKQDIVNINAIFVTCQGHLTVDHHLKGHWVYKDMLRHKADFFVHTGDIIYYDKDKGKKNRYNLLSTIQPLSKNITLARYRWNRMSVYPWNKYFLTTISSYFMKDDHDTLKNDCWPGQRYGQLTWKKALDVYKEQIPTSKLPYRRIRWGKDLEIWLLETREFRSNNNAVDGEKKTILGAKQKSWLKETIKQSDATFKLVVSPNPIVGPDKKNKNDNHSNKGFFTEGNELRNYLSKIKNTFVICGDRHWQYASKDSSGLVEISCGPINNLHASGDNNFQVDDESKLIYWGVRKGGYLRVEVTRENNIANISFIWHSDITSKGKINHILKYTQK